VGRSNTEIVAPPIDDTPPSLSMPTILNGCSGPRAITWIVSPTAKCFDDAVWASIAISSGPDGQWPDVRTSGFNRLFGVTLNARPGAPPAVITLPLCPTSCAWSETPPTACSTVGSARTFCSSAASNDGWFVLLSPFPTRLLPVMTASVLA
jgi:hypothetical protein